MRRKYWFGILKEGAIMFGVWVVLYILTITVLEYLIAA